MTRVERASSSPDLPAAAALHRRRPVCQRSAVFRQHRVQRHQRLAVWPRQRGRTNLVGEAGQKLTGAGQRRQTPDEMHHPTNTNGAAHRSPAVAPTTRCHRVIGERCDRLLETPHRSRDAGWCIYHASSRRPDAAPGNPARRNVLACRKACRGFARQALAHSLKARQEAADAGLRRRGHDILPAPCGRGQGEPTAHPQPANPIKCPTMATAEFMPPPRPCRRSPLASSSSASSGTARTHDPTTGQHVYTVRHDYAPATADNA